jgi:hypothetical protein
MMSRARISFTDPSPNHHRPLPDHANASVFESSRLCTFVRCLAWEERSEHLVSCFSGRKLSQTAHSPFCLRRNSRVAVWNASVFPSASKPIILDSRGQISRGTWSESAHLSVDTPPTKHMTQGKTRMSSLSTNHGTFSTKTRMNSVEKYFGANA